MAQDGPTALTAELHAFQAAPASCAALSVGTPSMQPAQHTPPFHSPLGLLLKTPQHHPGLCRGRCHVSHDCDNSLRAPTLHNRLLYPFHSRYSPITTQSVSSTVHRIFTLCCKRLYRLQVRQWTLGGGVCYQTPETIGYLQMQPPMYASLSKRQQVWCRQPGLPSSACVLVSHGSA